MVELLLVGRRSPAVAAARRLGLDFGLLDEQLRGPEGVAHAHVAFDDQEACVAAARGLVSPATRVLALTERAVGVAAAIVDAYGLRGAGAERAAPWRDKVRMKERASAAGLLVAAHAAVGPSDHPARLVERLGLPMVVKPRRSSGSRGVQLIRDEAELPERFEPDSVAEAFVIGTEMSVESFVIGGIARLVNVSEYRRVGYQNVVPGSWPADLDAAVREVNTRALTALGIESGVTHMEVFVSQEADGTPRVVFGELAHRPPGGKLMELISLAYGFDAWAAILEIALGRDVALPNSSARVAAVALLHPGEGTVSRVIGVEEARAVQNVVELACRVATGDQVTPRLGTGQSVGHVMVCADSREEALASLDAALECIQVATG